MTDFRVTLSIHQVEAINRAIKFYVNNFEKSKEAEPFEIPSPFIYCMPSKDYTKIRVFSNDKPILQTLILDFEQTIRRFHKTLFKNAPMHVPYGNKAAFLRPCTKCKEVVLIEDPEELCDNCLKVKNNE